MEGTSVELPLSIRSWTECYGIFNRIVSSQSCEASITTPALHEERKAHKVQASRPRSDDLTNVRLWTRLLISMCLNFLICLPYIYLFAPSTCTKPAQCTTVLLATFLVEDPAPLQASAIQLASKPALGC